MTGGGGGVSLLLADGAGRPVAVVESLVLRPAVVDAAARRVPLYEVQLLPAAAVEPIGDVDLVEVGGDPDVHVATSVVLARLQE
ncbi:hypothetical protein, partial [Actinoplanes sp. DH11]|uniref:hypothetical protein n=1 Tax=Actinoplanes sp. DH11 TaxID=2857011 RepID=UPI001E3B2321